MLCDTCCCECSLGVDGVSVVYRDKGSCGGRRDSSPNQDLKNTTLVYNSSFQQTRKKFSTQTPHPSLEIKRL